MIDINLPKVSIIIPAYNVAEYVEECLESIARQSYKDFEVLIIDDGSTDLTGSIVEKWALKDKRFCVTRIENHGVSYARNLGLSLKRGELVIFVDADDLVTDDYVATLVNMMEEQNCDCAVCGVVLFETTQPICKSGRLSVYQGVEVVSSMFLRGMSLGIWNKILRSSVIDKFNLRFEQDYSYTEDTLFMLRYFEKCSRIVFDSSEKYMYRQRPGSATHVMDVKKWSDFFHVFDEYVKAYKGNALATSRLAQHYHSLAYDLIFIAKNEHRDGLLLQRAVSMASWCDGNDKTIKGKLKIFANKYARPLLLLKRKIFNKIK